MGFIGCSEGHRPWQVSTTANFGALSPALFFLVPFFCLWCTQNCMVSPAPTQSPTVCPSITSLLSLPPNVLVRLAVGPSHHTQGLTEDTLCITPSLGNSLLHWCAVSFIIDLAGCIQHTPSPSASSCILNLKWRHLETSLTRGLTGSWFLEHLSRDSREPFQLG